jgi:hypothetical protein
MAGPAWPGPCWRKVPSSKNDDAVEEAVLVCESLVIRSASWQIKSKPEPRLTDRETTHRSRFSRSTSTS